VDLMCTLFGTLSVLALCGGVVAAGTAAPEGHRTDWFRDAQWGVFTHYLIGKDTTAEAWNKQVDAFDVPGLVEQLKAIGGKYHVITIGQNSGHYCAPNATYDKLTGIKPSKCSRRDLIADIAKALEPHGIRLMVYLPSGAPGHDHVARKKLGWLWGRKGGWQLPGEPVGGRLAEFQRRWEAVIREWSQRWGKSVHGWWFDGCYFADAMYRFDDEPNFASFAAAARAGNAESILAFNPGVKYPIVTVTEHEDYTAGEIVDPGRAECDGRWVGGAQWHMLSYLGTSWCKGSKPRFADDQVVEWCRDIIDGEGVATWDVPIRPSGLIPQPFVDQLVALRKGLAEPRRPKPAVPPGNLASHKRAKLLDVQGARRLSVNSGKHFARNGVDGDPATWAQAGGEWPWAYHVDLKAVHRIRKVVITFAPVFATEYKVNVSATGKGDWKTVAHRTGCTGGKQTHTFEPTPARYVRVLALKPDGPGQEGTQMGVAELEVYGDRAE